ncbi:hypothetical protein KEM55_009087, partial [Ascosphaera atra]
MRACAACRKRKIRCDAATTNTWPCSACTRLKLDCVPPSRDREREQQQQQQQQQQQLPLQSQSQSLIPPLNLASAVLPQSVPFAPYNPLYPGNVSATATATPLQPSALAYTAGVNGVNASNTSSSPSPDPTYFHHNDFQYPGANLLSSQSVDNLRHYWNPPPPAVPPPAPPPAPSDSSAPPVADLSDALGDLKIDETGIAPYIRQQRKGDPERPPRLAHNDPAEPSLATHLPEHVLQSTFDPIDGSIRIPQSLLPEESLALTYFDVFFTNIHPYIPVVHRASFYAAWQNDRDSISPLLLEAVFACAARFIDTPDGGDDSAKWLALAE